MIDVSDILFSKYSKKDFTLDILISNFPEIELTDIIKTSGCLLRIEGAIQVQFDSIQFTQKCGCVYCGKILAISKNIKNIEWIYYEKEPKEIEDMFEHLLIDTKKLKIDLNEALRQEILLNCDFNPHCKPSCEKKAPKEEKKDAGVKSLAKLKTMWRQ